MSIDPTHLAAGIAGLPAAQAKGPAVERAEQEADAQRRRVHHDRKAASASGVGAPDGEEHQSDDRDANDRHSWSGVPTSDHKKTPHSPRPSRDPTGQSGGMLDVTG